MMSRFTETGILTNFFYEIRVIGLNAKINPLAEIGILEIA